MKYTLRRFICWKSLFYFIYFVYLWVIELHQYIKVCVFVSVCFVILRPLITDPLWHHCFSSLRPRSLHTGWYLCCVWLHYAASLSLRPRWLGWVRRLHWEHRLNLTRHLSLQGNADHSFWIYNICIMQTTDWLTRQLAQRRLCADFIATIWPPWSRRRL